MLGFLAGVPGQLKTLADRLSATWAAKLDTLNTNYTLARAQKIDYLTSTVSSQGRSRSQIITSGTTWTAPAGVSSVSLLLIGGGGGGGGGGVYWNSTQGGSSGGGGGCSGEHVYVPNVVVTPGAAHSIILGSGGSGGGGGANGNNGGFTKFVGSIADYYAPGGYGGGNGSYTTNYTSSSVNGGIGSSVNIIGASNSQNTNNCISAGYPNGIDNSILYYSIYAATGTPPTSRLSVGGISNTSGATGHTLSIGTYGIFGNSCISGGGGGGGVYTGDSNANIGASGGVLYGMGIQSAAPGGNRATLAGGGGGGGSSLYGTGGSGGAGVSNSNQLPGGNATGYGAGGGGAGGARSSTGTYASSTGGNGTPGMIIVFWNE